MRYASLVFRALVCAVIATSSAPVPAQVVLQEDFQIWIDPFNGPVVRCSGLGGAGTYVFPQGWLLRNVDNRTPDAQVAYVNEAWEVREDFGLDSSNCVAFSTSYYSPVGVANDFMCTPSLNLPANPLLTWRARAYDPAFPDGYEVRVMTTIPTGGTGAIGNLLTASTVVASVPAENTTWTSRSVPLAGFANTAAWICFRNNSNDKFLLVLDDIVVLNQGPDAGLRDADSGSEYSDVPWWGRYPLAPSVTVAAAGAVQISNVVVDARARLGAVDRYTWQAPPIATLAALATATPVFAGTSPIDAAGTWTMSYSAAIAETDIFTGNNTAVSVAIDAGEEALSRVSGTAFQATGVSATGGGELGSSYDLFVSQRLRAVRYSLLASGAAGWPGQNVVVRVRAWDATNQRPGAVIASTLPHVATAAAADVTATFAAGPLLLQPGRYVVVIDEPNGQPMPLATTDRIFRAGTTWVRQPGMAGTWSTVLASAPPLSRVPNITLLLDPLPDALFANSFENEPPGVQATAPTVIVPQMQPLRQQTREPVVLESMPEHLERR